MGARNAFNVMYRAGPIMADGPQVITLVDLDEGVRCVTNIVGCDPSEVPVGMPVRVLWDPLSDGRNLPVFEPDAT